MKVLRNPFCWRTPPTDPRTAARKIPEGSTVRRRLFADDGPAEASGNPNMIKSTKDVNRLMQVEEDRAAQRWNFDTQREESISNRWEPWYPEEPLEDPRVHFRPWRVHRGDACRRQMESARYIIAKYMDSSEQEYANAIGHMDNLTNELMDDSVDSYAESAQHWNFDFDNKKPTAEGGMVDWQKVGSHWVGNKPGTSTRLVLYTTAETEKGENTPSHEETHEEPKKGNADESALKPTDQIEHLFTDKVDAIYGDWRREIKTGIKVATEQRIQLHILNEVYENERLVRLTNQHHQISKSEAIAIIRGADTDDDDDDDYVDDVDDTNVDKTLLYFAQAKEHTTEDKGSSRKYATM